MAAQDARVLSYHDVLLRAADVDLLRGQGQWLNDQVIAFYFEFLLNEVRPQLAHSVCLIPGAMAFLLRNSDPSEAALIFEPLQLHTKQLVIFAVNDNPDATVAAGGAHWSCLAFYRPSSSFRHYDSCRPHNSRVARDLAGAAAPLVRSRGAGDASPQQLLPTFVEVATMPQQHNGHDCGLYVLGVADALCKAAGRGGMAACGREQQPHEEDEHAEARMLQVLTPGRITQLRADVLGVIETLAAAGSGA